MKLNINSALSGENRASTEATMVITHTQISFHEDIHQYHGQDWAESIKVI